MVEHVKNNTKLELYKMIKTNIYYEKYLDIIKKTNGEI